MSGQLNIAFLLHGFLARPTDGCRVAYFGFGRLALARWQLSCLTVVALLGVTDRWEGPSPGIPEGILGCWTAGIPRAYFGALSLLHPG